MSDDLEIVDTGGETRDAGPSAGTSLAAANESAERSYTGTLPNVSLPDQQTTAAALATASASLAIALSIVPLL